MLFLIIPLGEDLYVLVEIALDIFPAYISDVLFKLQLAGFIPILAHVERFAWLQKNTDLQVYFKLHDIKFQINYVTFLDLRHNPTLKNTFPILG